MGFVANGGGVSEVVVEPWRLRGRRSGRDALRGGSWGWELANGEASAHGEVCWRSKGLSLWHGAHGMGASSDLADVGHDLDTE